ncbi:rhodanese-like domain-containing protein [Desulforhopalus sp. IMCC35007]|uniref:rhodanese-like domain-containing protein n=1 Tax=Desulforhopalus sp. IMCC35007 TaxID=2569543 RepID=UPI0010ADD4EA|nr:rhodanese-like domain-containing protein [Desulforhopalus sp. IMCC35007]TKB11358.1 rhodanese-like domain-containing protein [Desulforhopalus sp. IMCC35007]
MSNSKKKHLLVAAFILLLVTPIAGKSEDATQNPVIGSCEGCPATTDTKVLKGTLDVISFKASMLQLATGTGAKVITFSDDTILIGTETFSSIASDSDLEIEYLNEDGVLLAVSITVASKAPILESNQINAKTLSKLISANTTPFTLIDARTDQSYSQAHIPGAVSIYNGVFAKNIDKLPANKQQLIVYYCDGTA